MEPCARTPPPPVFGGLYCPPPPTFENPTVMRAPGGMPCAFPPSTTRPHHVPCAWLCMSWDVLCIVLGGAEPGLPKGGPQSPFSTPPHLPPPGGGLQGPALLFPSFSCVFHDKTAGTVTVCPCPCHCVTPKGGGDTPTVVSRSNTSPHPQPPTPYASWSQKFQTFALRKDACGPWSPFPQPPLPEFGGVPSPPPPPQVKCSPALCCGLPTGYRMAPHVRCAHPLHHLQLCITCKSCISQPGSPCCPYVRRAIGWAGFQLGRAGVDRAPWLDPPPPPPAKKRLN